MARPKSSKACSIGSISRGQGSWYQHRPICFKKFFHCSSYIWANVVIFLGVEGRDIPEYPATWRRWRFHPEPMTFSLLYEYRPIPPFSRHHIEPVPEYSNVGGSHHLIIAGQSVFHLYDQGCSALSSRRQHNGQCPTSNLLRPLAQRGRETLWETTRRVVKVFL